MKRFLLTVCFILVTTCAWADRAQYMPDIVVTEPGAVWTDMRAYPSDGDSKLYNAIEDIGATNSILLVSENVTLLEDTLVPSNVTLKFTAGSVITLGAFDITIVSPFRPGPNQVFNQDPTPATGRVSFLGNTTTENIYSEWWGAIVDDGTNDLIHIQSAIDAAETISGGKVQLLVGEYDASGTLEINRRMHFSGMGITETTITQNSDADLIYVNATDTYAGITIEDMTIRWGSGAGAASAGSHGIYIYDADDDPNSNKCTAWIKNVFITSENGTTGFLNGIHTQQRTYITETTVSIVENNCLYATAGADIVEVTGGTFGYAAESGIVSLAYFMELNNVETVSNGTNEGGNEYAVDAGVLYVKGGFFNFDFNGIKIVTGSIIGATFDQIGLDMVTTPTANNTDADAIIIATSAIDQYQVLIQGCRFMAPARHCINIGEDGGAYVGPRISIVGNSFFTASYGTGVTDGLGIYAFWARALNIVGNTFDDALVEIDADNTTIIGNRFTAGAAYLGGTGALLTYGTGSIANKLSGNVYQNDGTGAQVVSGALTNFSLCTFAGNRMVSVATAGNPYTISPHETGAIFANSDSVMTWNLPKAQTGLEYSFVVFWSEAVHIHPLSGDQINYAGAAADDRITSATSGDTITIRALNTTTWIAMAVGAVDGDYTDTVWTDGGP